LLLLFLPALLYWESLQSARHRAVHQPPGDRHRRGRRRGGARFGDALGPGLGARSWVPTRDVVERTRLEYEELDMEEVRLTRPEPVD
jgi:hypothetical protein